MVDSGWRRLCAVMLLLWLALGWPLQGMSMTPVAMSMGSPAAPDADGCDDPDDGGTCPSAACAFCSVLLLPADLILPAGAEPPLAWPADASGRGLAVRPHPPPPRHRLPI